MKIFDLSDGCVQIEALPQETVTVFGFFDGVHIGHAALISSARDYAESIGAPLCVWTFDSLPKARLIITDNSEKLAALSALGVSFVVFEDYAAVRYLPSDDFFSGYILPVLSPAAVFCGFNFNYGKNAAGNAASFERSASEHGIFSSVLPPFEIDGKPLSSSFIRSLISDGKVDEANKYLTMKYSFTSPVLHGRRIGHTLGFPTVNQRPDNKKLLPPFGVYACTVAIDEMTFGGVCNIGIRPTVNGDGRDVTLESHIFGYSGNAYGKSVTVSLISMIRPERKFSSHEELSEQIMRDADAARTLLACEKTIPIS